MPSRKFPSRAAPMAEPAVAAAIPVRRGEQRLCSGLVAASSRELRTAHSVLDHWRRMLISPGHRADRPAVPESRNARVSAEVECRDSPRSRQYRFGAYGPSEETSELSELVGRSCISDYLLDGRFAKRVSEISTIYASVTTPLQCLRSVAEKIYQNDSHLVIFSRNTFSGTVRKRSPASRESRNGAASASEWRP